MAEGSSKATIRITLTPAQTEQVREATGRELLEIELTIDELEQRVAPRLASNHNETFLIGQ